MPGPYEIVLARVQQKVDTLAGWLAVEDELGPILPGEQAFEINESGVLTNFKIGDGTKKYSELPYFITYFSNVLNQKILKYIDGNTDITISSIFRQYSCMYDIIVFNNSGSNIDLKVGTSVGGNQLMEVVIPNGVYPINLRKVFQADTTVYLSGLAGKNYSIFIVYFQYDENPATPPVGDPSAFKWPRCFRGQFEPLNDTDLDNTWDFTTGLGKPGTAYSNCAISGTNGTEDMGRFYPVGWQVGDNLRPATTFGSTAGEITITEANLPKHNHHMFSLAHSVGQLASGINHAPAWTSNHSSGNQDYDMKQAGDDNQTAGITSSFGQDIPDPIDIRPKSKVVLYFVAISD